MNTSPSAWSQRVERWRGGGPIERDLSPYQEVLRRVNEAGQALRGLSNAALRDRWGELRAALGENLALDEALVDVFALTREVAERTVGMRPFDVQVMGAVALHQRRVLEMQTGEGKTLVAVLPAILNAVLGHGVHILTFNDYLARRDADWMGPAYRFLGLTVGCVQDGMTPAERRQAYEADITYASAKQAGFDFLRMHLARSTEELVHRPFHFAIVDEADSILIDEARVPLVIAGERESSDASPYDIARLIAGLREGSDWETDENRRNVYLTDRGLDRIESELGVSDLHADEHYLLLTEVNQALHARTLIQRDVDYIVREEAIELVDEFTGRVVPDRRWPDGLQTALEAKEGLRLLPGGHILGSITMQHFLAQYPRLAGMTATARSGASELEDFYGLKTVVLPPNRPCVRKDLPDHIFTHREAKDRAVVREIEQTHNRRRPVLVGTQSVEESEKLAGQLLERGIPCQVLNARNDAAEAEIIARAGAPGAVTISTNMAGRGTDIKLGGADEKDREEVLELGGLFVIGTNRHESRRIDDQLRGRAGRQGDPGSSRFFVSLEDDLMIRFGIDDLIPPKLRPDRQQSPITSRVVRSEVDRIQRIVEGQNFDIRKTLRRYSDLIEKQRKLVYEWRMDVLSGAHPPELCVTEKPDVYERLSSTHWRDRVEHLEREITLAHIDRAWSEHLQLVARVREGIHLVGLGGLDPLHEFHKQVGEAFSKLAGTVEERVVESFMNQAQRADPFDLADEGLLGPASTWTYLVNDQVANDLHQMLFGSGSTAISAGAAVMLWPVLIVWGFRRWMKGWAQEE